MTGRFPWSRVPAYVAAQVVGALLGTVAILAVLGPQASEVGLGVAAFADGVGFGQGFAAEFVGTFALVLVVFGLGAAAAIAYTLLSRTPADRVPADRAERAPVAETAQ